MYELFVFPTEIEHASTKQLVRHSFPMAELCDVVDPRDPDDIFMDFRYDIKLGLFLRWAVDTTEGGNRVLHYCYNLSIALVETPCQNGWSANSKPSLIYSIPCLANEISRLSVLLYSGAMPLVQLNPKPVQ